MGACCAVPWQTLGFLVRSAPGQRCLRAGPGAFPGAGGQARAAPAFKPLLPTPPAPGPPPPLIGCAAGTAGFLLAGPPSALAVRGLRCRHGAAAAAAPAAAAALPRLAAPAGERHLACSRWARRGAAGRVGTAGGAAASAPSLPAAGCVGTPALTQPLRWLFLPGTERNKVSSVGCSCFADRSKRLRSRSRVAADAVCSETWEAEGGADAVPGADVGSSSVGAVSAEALLQLVLLRQPRCHLWENTCVSPGVLIWLSCPVYFLAPLVFLAGHVF